MADDRDEATKKLQKKIRKLEAALKIVADHSGKTENRMRKQFEVVSETIPVPMIISNENDEIIFANLSAQKVFGYSPDDLTRLKASSLYDNPDDRKLFLKILPAKEEVSGFRVKFKKSEGSVFPVALFSRGIYFDGQDCILTVVHDLTEVMALEKQLRQSQKMEAIGTLAAGMGHEINNPLAALMQTANVMADRLGNTNIPASLKAAEKAGTTMEAIRNFMEARGIPRMIATINESGRRIADIVGNMLSFTRKSDDRTSSHALEELLDKTLELAASDYDLKKYCDFKTIRIKKEYEDNLPFVPCEGANIQQALLNILRNGTWAMQVAATEKPLFIVRTRFEESRKMVCIEIEDNGSGMDEETRKRVFEPFYTTKPVGTGTGLGLSVSYFIITENHGGEIAVESRLGFGTKFIIRLPMENGKGKR